jgi:hypothetical protein
MNKQETNKQQLELKDIVVVDNSSNINNSEFKGKVELRGKAKEKEENSNDADDNDLHVISNKDKFTLPSELKCTFIMTIILFCVGAVLIGIGFIDAIYSEVPGISISMWTLGGITFIPGGYYAYQFYKAYRASGTDREDIFDNIPEI